METQALPENIFATKMASLIPSVARAKSQKKDENFRNLKQLLLSRKAHVGVIGLGYVGLPLSMAFNAGGYRVTGLDVSEEKVKLIQQGKSYIPDVPSQDVSKYVKNKKFSASTDFSVLEKCDVIVVCVPTPLSKTKDPDMSYIISAVDRITDNLRPGQLLILESTTYPGTTRDYMLPRVEVVGRERFGSFEAGIDFFIAFSPERVDPGNPKYNTQNTPKVVGGLTPRCGELASIFYANSVDKVVRVSSPESAEMVKLLENTFRAVNIGLVNEVAIMCEKLNIDCWEVIEAASSKPFGFMPFYPGPGLGGHCIPIDPSYLSWKLRSLNYTARFIELATSINSSMPHFVVDKVAFALNEEGKAVRNSKILILGVAYKKDIDDMRESPALDVIHSLQARGANVDYYDPFVPTLDWEGMSMKSVAWTKDIGKKYDAVVIITDHSKVDYAAVLKSSKRIVDTRNAMKDFRDEKIHKL
jgi:UDP-N-acetyl-D-glucosamine dehydrogenase